MKRFALFFSVLLLPLYVSSDVFTWSDQLYESITEYTYTLEDAAGEYTIEQVSSPEFESRFTKVDRKILSFGITSSFHWIKFELNNPTEAELLLEIAQFSLPVCEFYFMKNGAWKKIRSGYGVNVEDRIIKDHFQVFNLSYGAEEYYLKVKSFSPPIPLKVWEKNSYESKTAQLKLSYGIYFGILVFVILNNIFLFFSFRNLIHLHYAFLVLIHIFTSAFVMDGWGLYLFNDLNLTGLYTYIPMINMANTALYGILFLEINKFTSKKVNMFAWAVFIYFLSYMVWSLLLPHMVVITINQISALLSLSFVVYLGLIVAQHGNRVGRYFASAYLLYFFIVILEVIYIQLGWPKYIFGLSYVAFAMFLEVIILSFALTKRFQWEQRAQIKATLDAQDKLIEQTKENERIVLAQNTLLEEKVHERTAQLEQSNTQLGNTLHAVEKEKAKAEEILLNILPRATVKELQEKGYAEPKNYEIATILFTDIKDFTSTTSALSPQRLVEGLNECFKGFDSIILDLGLEKIKTIGDCYMAASGLPNERNDHAIIAVEAGLRMMEFMEEWKEKQAHLGKLSWEARTGIHSGQVIAGVVGAHKYAFDIWGDAVNTAARMETNSAIGKVNISTTTNSLVRSYFNCIPRGRVDVKGKGEMEMFWVERPLKSN
ncbi:MAG: hypothetical protein HQ556_05700 [Candidatus Marinimicrobia bacterium]|nr:hypothetical protein [Candidatus Neomarinimicrobiota bacterium]